MTIRRHVIAAALLCGAGGLLSPRIEAQSFDCSRVTSSVERTICEDRSLTELDNDLSRQLHYFLALTSSGRPLELKIERRWIASRNQRCNVADMSKRLTCLEAAYNKRIEDLRNLIQISRETTPPDDAKIAAILGPWSGDYGRQPVQIQLLIRRDRIYENDEGHPPSCPAMEYSVLGQAGKRYFLELNVPRQCLYSGEEPTKYFSIELDDAQQSLRLRDCNTSGDLLKLVSNPNDGSVYCSDLGLSGLSR